MTPPSAKSAHRVLLLGVTGTIGRATAAALVARGLRRRRYPETGRDSLRDLYRGLLDGSASVERADHAVFRDSTERS